MEERDLLECCGSIKFASEMASASPFSSLQHTLDVASDIWCNKINVHSWRMSQLSLADAVVPPACAHLLRSQTSHLWQPPTVHFR
ncbi:hypothetical protein AHAS_Ahas17G0257000 [Arachis hypogaea]